MKLSTLLTSALASLATAAPTGVEKRQSPNLDLTVLQFALTLEHLENVFYKGALQKFSQQDFINAGYSATYYNNLKFIAYDEESHVKALTAAIQAAGATPVAACQYSFPYTDVASFITLSSVLEGVGTSAYLGGAPLITSKDYLTVAGSILVTEALHTSYQRAAKGAVPFANAYGTPLDPTAVFTLAASFITSCPAGNAPLPFTAFPALTYNAPAGSGLCESPDCAPSAAIKKRDWTSSPVSSPAPAPAKAAPAPAKSSDYSWDNTGMGKMAPAKAGQTVSFTSTKDIPAGTFVTFISGLSVVSVQGTISGSTISVAIPSVAMGQTYVLLTNMDVEGTLVDSAVIAGPAIVEVFPAAPSIDYNYQK